MPTDRYGSEAPGRATKVKVRVQSKADIQDRSPVKVPTDNGEHLRHRLADLSQVPSAKRNATAASKGRRKTWGQLRQETRSQRWILCPLQALQWVAELAYTSQSSSAVLATSWEICLIVPTGSGDSWMKLLSKPRGHVGGVTSSLG
jgi:hypothetical protein